MDPSSYSTASLHYICQFVEVEEQERMGKSGLGLQSQTRLTVKLLNENIVTTVAPVLLRGVTPSNISQGEM